MSLLKLGVEDASLSAAFVAEDSCEPVESQVKVGGGWCSKSELQLRHAPLLYLQLLLETFRMCPSFKLGT